MSQLWSVSANIAAYASESVRLARRPPRKKEIEKAAEELRRQSEPDASPHPLINLAAAAPSLSLFTSTRQNPQTTFEQALHAYEENQDPPD